MKFDIRASENLLGGINRESGGNIDLQTKVIDVAILLSTEKTVAPMPTAWYSGDVVELKTKRRIKDDD